MNWRIYRLLWRTGFRISLLKSLRRRALVWHIAGSQGIWEGEFEMVSAVMGNPQEDAETFTGLYGGERS